LPSPSLPPSQICIDTDAIELSVDSLRARVRGGWCLVWCGTTTVERCTVRRVTAARGVKRLQSCSWEDVVRARSRGVLVCSLQKPSTRAQWCRLTGCCPPSSLRPHLILGGKANVAANGMLGAVIGLAAAATDTMIRSAGGTGTASPFSDLQPSCAYCGLFWVVEVRGEYLSNLEARVCVCVCVRECVCVCGGDSSFLPSPAFLCHLFLTLIVCHSRTPTPRSQSGHSKKVKKRACTTDISTPRTPLHNLY
jgi:hypothetical protein